MAFIFDLKDTENFFDSDWQAKTQFVVDNIGTFNLPYYVPSSINLHYLGF